MLPLFRRIVALALVCAGFGAGARAAGLALPPLDGEITGRIAVTALAGAPELRWSVRARTTKPDERVFDLALDGEGTRLRAQVGLDAAGAGWWKISEAALDMAAWFPAAAAQAGVPVEGIVAKGRVELRGGGSFRDGVPGGTLSVAWSDGALWHEADGWRLEGIGVQGDFLVEGADYVVTSTTPLALSVRTISTNRFGARNFSASGLVQADRTLALSAARIEVAGGEVTVDPCVVALLPPSLEVAIRIANVGLQDVAALVPAGLSESRGRINGTVRLGWSEEKGFQLGDGNLVLGTTEPAVVRLARSPGFLTDHVPMRIDLLPAWLGPLARWVRPENPAYAEMLEIEQGRTELQVEGLSVQLSPGGDAAGRTARVRLTARPSRPGSVVESLTIDVNVSGPLAQVLRMGMKQSFSVEMR